jgi:Rv0078B-related antitoxin
MESAVRRWDWRTSSIGLHAYCVERRQRYACAARRGGAGLPYGGDTDLVCDNIGMTPAEKFRAALELHEAGVAVMRQNLRRRNPDASDAEIDELLSAWLRTRPGAEHGDAVGRPSSRLRG